MVQPTIRIAQASNDTHTGGCGACHASAAGPVCRIEFGADCVAPALHGPQDQIERVMAALRTALGNQGGDGVHLVRALRLDDGEAELTLAVEPRCGGLALADIAFQTLRQLLPDTDIYVRHAAA